MNIDMNESRALANTGELRARAVCALKCTVIVGVILACSGSSSPASSQEPPVIEQVTGTTAKEFASCLSDLTYENVEFVALAYGEGEIKTLRVLVFPPEGKEIREIPEFNWTEFVIPQYSEEFDEAIVLYTRSPGNAATCGRRAEDGGRSCRSFCVVGGTPMSPCPTG
jgi:hypothetical protein